MVATDGGFHGRTMGALALTGQPGKQEPFLPLPGDVTHVPYGDAQALRAAVTEDTALVIIEPIQGENGVVVPPAGYLKAAREITAATGTLLVLDEVQTGIGRTGHWFEYQAHEGVAARRRHPRQGPRRRSAARRDRRLRPRPPTCCSPATTARPSAATRSPAPPDSPCWTPSRPRGCWRTSSAPGEELRDGIEGATAGTRSSTMSGVRGCSWVSCSPSRSRRRCSRRLRTPDSW